MTDKGESIKKLKIVYDEILNREEKKERKKESPAGRDDSCSCLVIDAVPTAEGITGDPDTVGRNLVCPAGAALWGCIGFRGVEVCQSHRLTDGEGSILRDAPFSDERFPCGDRSASGQNPASV